MTARLATKNVAAGGERPISEGEAERSSTPPVVHPRAAVMGLDLSLTSTGCAGPGWSCVVKPIAALTGIARIRWIARMAVDLAESGKVMLVVVEGPAYRKGHDAGAHERAGLWWHVVHMMDLRGYPLAVAGPSSLKMYATGKGNAGKDDVLLACARRFPAFTGGNDEADATWLAAMGADWLGKPMTVVPAKQRASLDKVVWPAGVKR